MDKGKEGAKLTNDYVAGQPAVFNDKVALQSARTALAVSLSFNNGKLYYQIELCSAPGWNYFILRL